MRKETIFDTAARERLLDFVKENRVSHAYILTGPAGSGKKALAVEFAAALVCRGGNRPCGACDQCRKAFEGLHQDIHIITDGVEGKSIGVDRVREIGKNAYVAPGESVHAVYIIENADKMTAQAQNALLKVLEEPPEPVVFLLLTANLCALLPTVRSRAAILRITPPRTEWTTERLSEIYPEHNKRELEAAAAFGLSAESDEKSLENTSEQIHWAQDFLKALTQGNKLQFYKQYTRIGKNKTALISAAESVRKLCCDLINAKEGIEEGRYFAGQASLAANIADTLTKKKILGFYTVATETARLLDGTYSNTSLAAIVFLNQLWEETH